MKVNLLLMVLLLCNFRIYVYTLKEDYMKISIRRSIFIALTIAMAAGFIYALPFFIPGTPEFSLGQNYYAISKGDGKLLSDCGTVEYKKSMGMTSKQYLMFASKISMSQKVKIKELKAVKDKLGVEFNYLTEDDIVKFKVYINDDGVFFMDNTSTVILIRNKVYTEKNSWLVTP